MQQDISIVLCQTSHPGNIGATARAMKNMGLTQLILVSPHRFPDREATERASGADDILVNARIVSTVEEAVVDAQWIFGTSARSRAFPWPQLVPFAAAAKIQQYSSQSQKIAVLFGNEQSGLSNDQLQLCDYHITIPTHRDFASLNLGAAVQVITYEIFQAFCAGSSVVSQQKKIIEKATSQEVLGLFHHFEEVAVQLKFLDPTHPKKLLPRIKKLLTKAQLEKEEIHILRGFLKSIQNFDR